MFLHISAPLSAQDSKTEGQRVEFSITQGQKGPQAENIVAV